jgi:hypothetical protein
MIIFILVAFLLSTALTSIMYLGGSKTGTTGEVLTGIVDTTGAIDATGSVLDSGIVVTGEAAK